MRVNAQPTYPLLLLDPKGWLGWSADSQKMGFSLYGALNTRRWAGFDSSGTRWQVSRDSFRYRDTWWTRLLANTVYNPRFEAELKWAPAGRYTLQELQDQICVLVDRDDDILTQFAAGERIKSTVRACRSFAELTGKLRKMRVISQ